MTNVAASLAMLTPYEVSRKKVRVGPNADGGYVLLEDLDPTQTLLSYGIGAEFRFDEEMARRGHKVYMFDHTIDPVHPKYENMFFYSEGVAGASDPGRKLYSIEDHLERCEIEGERLILKIDVEGVEYEALSALTTSTLRRFDQIILEAHGLGHLADDDFRRAFDATIAKLNEHFTLFHVHANNYDGATFDIVEGLCVANIIELSYVNSSSVKRIENRTLYPSSLDFPCVDREDKLLWIYPFLPTTVSTESFLDCTRRAEGLLGRRDRLISNTRDFDAHWYGSYYKDLASFDEDTLALHFKNHGAAEGRFGSGRERAAFEQEET